MKMNNYPELRVLLIDDEQMTLDSLELELRSDYITNIIPINDNRDVTPLLENKHLRSYNLSEKPAVSRVFSKIITRNSTMLALFKYMESIAGTNKPVLITGETGTGKQLIAEAIHLLSGREGKFVFENISGLTDEMFSDTLFGHKKGAYSGAIAGRNGLVELAKHGTLFLDEIGDLSLASQLKLLQLLQESVYRPIGSDLFKHSHTRIIAATNCDLAALQESKQFRTDLYYRLNVHMIHIPPLRERKDDLALLIEHFLEKAARELDKKKPTAPPEFIHMLRAYDFPGNIRELESIIFNAVSNHQVKEVSPSLFRQIIKPYHVPDYKQEEQAQTRLSYTGTLPTLKEVEDFIQSEAMRLADNNITIAAELLGISRSALSKRLKKKRDS